VFVRNERFQFFMMLRLMPPGYPTIEWNGIHIKRRKTLVCFRRTVFDITIFLVVSLAYPL